MPKLPLSFEGSPTLLHTPQGSFVRSTLKLIHKSAGLDLGIFGEMSGPPTDLG